MGDRVINSSSKTVVAAGPSTGVSTEYPLTGWLPTTGVKTVRTLLQLTGPSSNFKVTAGYQLAATDTTDPGSWTAIGSGLTAQGREVEGVDLGTVVDEQYFIRFGVIAENTSATYGFENGDVSLRVGIST